MFERRATLSAVRMDGALHRPRLLLLLQLPFLAILLVSLLANGVACFEKDTLYRYDLEGTVTTRAADHETPQYAGYAFQSRLLVRATNKDELLLQLEKPQMGTFNELVNDWTTFTVGERVKPMENAGGLDKPFRVYLDEDGSITGLDIYPDEAKWAVNFKRGLLGFFQLNLGKPSSTETYFTVNEKSVFGDCDTDYLIASLPSETESSSAELNVTKTRNMAKCKTRFIHRFLPIDSSECVASDKDAQQYKHSNAIFNYNLVGTRSNYVIKRAQLDEEATFAPFGLSAHTHSIQTCFTLRLSSQTSGGSLAAAEGAARIDSLAYDPPELQNFYAYVNLEEAHHMANIGQITATVDQVMEAFEVLVGEQKAYFSAFESSLDHSASADTSAREAARKELENSRIAMHFVRLNSLVATLSFQKIEQLYARVEELGDAHKRAFWDLMSVSGTNPSIMFMKKLINDGDAPLVKIKSFLSRLSFHIKMPSKSLFDEYVNLCRADKIQADQQSRRTCLLPLSSLIHQHCVKPHAKYVRSQQEGSNGTAYKKAQNVCQLATAEEYFSRLVVPVMAGQSSGGPSGGTGSTSAPPAADGSSSSASSPDEMSLSEKVLNVKLASELGVKPSVEYLLEVVRARQAHPTLRSVAMWGLKKSAIMYPNLVKRQVVPFFYDRTELTELRIAAFHNWLYTGMHLHEMETMARKLETEPNRQLVSYMSSLFKSMAELKPFPCLHSQDTIARQVLPLIEKALKRQSAAPVTTYRDSQTHLSSMWQDQYGYGSATRLSMIHNNGSNFVPSHINYAKMEIMSGLKFAPIDVSVQTFGLDKPLARLANMIASKSSFMDIFSLNRRSRRHASADQEASPESAAKLSARDLDDMYVMVSMSFYGRPVVFFDREGKDLKKMLADDGTIKIPHIKKLIRSFSNQTVQQLMINFEKLELFNNEMGLPLLQMISDFEFKSIKLNSIRLDMEPGFFRDERQGKPVSRFSLALDAKSGRHKEMFVWSGALLTHSKQRLGAGFHRRKILNVPINLVLAANMSGHQVNVHLQPLQDGLLYIKQTPVTFVKSYDPSLTAEQRRAALSWRPLYRLDEAAAAATKADETANSSSSSSAMRPFSVEYLSPLALGAKLEGKHRADQDYSLASWRKYVSSVGLPAAEFLYLYSPTGAPLELRLSTITSEESANPTRNLTLAFAWRHYHDEGEEEQKSAAERELESYTSSSGSGKPTTVYYKLSLLGGSAAAAKERYVSAEFAYSRSSDRKLNKWRLNYERSQLNQDEAPFALCWTGDLKRAHQTVQDLLRTEARTLINMEYSATKARELNLGEKC